MEKNKLIATQQEMSNTYNFMRGERLTRKIEALKYELGGVKKYFTSGASLDRDNPPTRHFKEMISLYENVLYSLSCYKEDGVYRFLLAAHKNLHLAQSMLDGDFEYDYLLQMFPEKDVTGNQEFYMYCTDLEKAARSLNRLTACLLELFYAAELR